MIIRKLFLPNLLSLSVVASRAQSLDQILLITQSSLVTPAHSLLKSFNWNQSLHSNLIWEVIPPNLELIYKKLWIYSYVFKLQAPSKCSPFAIHLLRHFFHCSQQFLNPSILIPFSASGFFCLFCFVFKLHLFHIGKMLPFEDFFASGETNKKSHLG